MAESFIQLAPDSTGKKAHSFQRVIGANTVEDEVILLGHPYEALYFIDPGGFSTTATANSHLFQIMAGSSLVVYVHRIIGYLNTVPGATTALQFQCRRLTTAGTGGVANVIAALDSTDSPAGATSQVLPTVKGTEGAILGDQIGVLPSALPSTFLRPIVFDFDFYSSPHLKPLRIPAGTSNGVCIKNTAALATANLLVVATISESNF